MAIGCERLCILRIDILKRQHVTLVCTFRVRENAFGFSTNAISLTRASLV